MSNGASGDAVHRLFSLRTSDKMYCKEARSSFKSYFRVCIRLLEVYAESLYHQQANNDDLAQQ